MQRKLFNILIFVCAVILGGIYGIGVHRGLNRQPERLVHDGNTNDNEYIDVRKLSGRIPIKKIDDTLYLRWEITQRDVEKIGDMNSLKELDFYINDSSIDLSPLADLNNLEKLTISSTHGCTDLDTHSLGEIEQLREITLYACDFDISFLAELPNIEAITLLKCDVDDISVFKDIDTLKVLNVGYINDVDLNYLSNLINLEEIVITGYNIRNFEGLKNLINTRRLALCDYDDSRTGDMNMLVEMDRLENIFIAHIKIEDISPLAELANLRMITLIDTDISDIEPLTELKNLSSLTIMGNENMQIKEQAEKSFIGVETLVSEDIPYPY